MNVHRKRSQEYSNEYENSPTFSDALERSKITVLNCHIFQNLILKWET